MKRAPARPTAERVVGRSFRVCGHWITRSRFLLLIRNGGGGGGGGGGGVEFQNGMTGVVRRQQPKVR